MFLEPYITPVRIVETFTLEYFTVYDSHNANDRQKLFQAYKEDAMFTLTIEKLDPKASFSDREVFMEYKRDSHNVKQIEKWEKYRQKLISKGALNVVSRLTRLPKTKHLLHSFLVDVSFAAETVMCFTVEGLFRDGELAETEGAELKFFSRTFLVIPKGEGKIAVVNEELFISPFSKDQADCYQRMLQRAVNQQNNQVEGANPAVAGPSTGSSQVPRPVMVENFAKESGMKPMWAEKCLEDNEWSYEKAAQVFLEMKEKNIIPPEAFV